LSDEQKIELSLDKSKPPILMFTVELGELLAELLTYIGSPSTVDGSAQTVRKMITFFKNQNQKYKKNKQLDNNSDKSPESNILISDRIPFLSNISVFIGETTKSYLSQQNYSDNRIEEPYRMK